eukprot:13303834-Alexandrium_andersonii.AAC.1
MGHTWASGSRPQAARASSATSGSASGWRTRTTRSAASRGSSSAPCSSFGREGGCSPRTGRRLSA